jgi:hypothetical protein
VERIKKEASVIIILSARSKKKLAHSCLVLMGDVLGKECGANIPNRKDNKDSMFHIKRLENQHIEH